MIWNLDKTKPICPQIYEQLCVQIASGEIQPGQRLLSVRDLALETGVNPNTVQRSYELLEQQGIIDTVRNSGRFVAQDISVARQTVSKLQKEKTQSYFEAMMALGLKEEEIKIYVKEWAYE